MRAETRESRYQRKHLYRVAGDKIRIIVWGRF